MGATVAALEGDVLNTLAPSLARERRAAHEKTIPNASGFRLRPRFIRSIREIGGAIVAARSPHHAVMPSTVVSELISPVVVVVVAPQSGALLLGSVQEAPSE